ncbi:LysR family transcriptional regulator [Gluconobacter oxydans]|uniref:LysR family transcriptional regulator n=3 Tax=Gluconobacter oxydans TaxID=442 RepID=A0A829X200_GLUOY|nr:LysR family transcriptional regulator [Gluconobacter oxydans]AHK71511.1 transcriptional regulator, LysR family [Gluconobacter oxydans DSM 3504]KXV07425.1 LysR family transcriptional regulator [Gluconobacter oxydans]GEM17082.1 LysR family transcriptional regulator [Gluconobacter oxydans NBRC 3293]
MQPHRIPSLNWLRVFDAAARHQSFASAGRELNMSAAAVSQQILALETYLKKPLFLRSANKVRLTLEGNEFLPTIQVSLRAIEAKSASLFPRRDVERVSLVASQLMAMSWLPRRLTAFEKKHPSVRVDLITEDSQRNGEPDLAIRFDYVMTTREHPGWLMGISHVVVGQPQDVERITTAEAVMDYKLLDVRSHAVGWNTLLSRYPGISDTSALTVESVDTTPLALMMVKEGSALALVPWPAAQNLVEALGLTVCNTLPAIPGLGNYYIEQFSGHGVRPVIRSLFNELRRSSQKV